MLKVYDNLFQEILDIFEDTKDIKIHLDLPDDKSEKLETIENLNFLEEKRYIDIVAKASNFYLIKLNKDFLKKI